MSKPIRLRQAADMIQRDVAEILRREVNDPRLTQVTITAVDVAPDMRSAKIFYTAYDKDDLKEVQKALDKAAGFLRHQLASMVSLRHTPQLRFVYDESILYGEHLSALINETKDSDPDE